MLIRGICLDAAGTIIKITKPVAQTYTEIANRNGIPIEEASIAQAFRTVFPRMSPLAFGGTGADLDRQEREWWRSLVRNCLGRFGQHKGFNAFFDELYSHYSQPESWQVYDDVRPLLANLDARGIPAVVVSNFDTRLHGILHGFSMHDSFREVLCSSEVGSAKPDAKIFSAGCEVLGLPPEQVLHVGDDRRADYHGARDAGLLARWLNRTSATADDEEIQQVKSLDEIPGLIGD